MTKPFIFIASIRRTGSSVLSRALTLYPHSFIFQEPQLLKGKFKVSGHAVEAFGQHGIDLNDIADEIKRQRKELRQNPDKKKREIIGSSFRDSILPRLLAVYKQIGVKEIWNEGWEVLREAFPAMKVLVTSRDPRDIYISLYYKVHQDGKNVRLEGDFTPENVASDIMREFNFQREILDKCDCMKVRYEDFCTDPGLIGRIKEFTQNDVPGTGEIGKMNVHHKAIHGGEITDKRIMRWKAESDEKLVADAQKVFDLIPEYGSYWGYDKEKGAVFSAS